MNDYDKFEQAFKNRVLHECFIVSTRNALKKASGDRIFLDEGDAKVHCKELNKAIDTNVFKVFHCLVLVDKEPI